jgi:hypothetical protein
MTLQSVQIGEGQIFLPLQSDQQPDGLFIRSISFYDISQAIYNVSYSVEYNSLFQSFSSFVAYPQVITVETSGLAYSVFDTEEIIDDKYFSMIPPLLIEFYEQQLNYKQISSLTAVSFISLVYYNGDVLFLFGLPNGISVYSLNTGKFYNVKLPTSALSQQNVGTSYTFLGGYLFGAITQKVAGTILVNLVSAKFTYSDTVFTSVSTQSVNAPQDIYRYTINIVGNTSYVVAVVRYTYVLEPGNVLTAHVSYVVYDITNDTITTATSSSFSNASLVTGLTSIASILYTIGEKVTSIYGYYVFTVLFDKSNTSEIIVSFNIGTSEIETVEIPVNLNQFEVVLQKNYLILLAGSAQVIQQGNVYFLPVSYQIFELTTSNMVEVQYYTIALEHNNLVISGKAINVQTGNPVSGATIGVYYALSSMGNQLSVSNLIGTTKTDSNGEFTFTYQFKHAPSDLDVVITASVDPIILNYIEVKPNSILGKPY